MPLVDRSRNNSGIVQRACVVRVLRRHVSDPDLDLGLDFDRGLDLDLDVVLDLDQIIEGDP